VTAELFRGFLASAGDARLDIAALAGITAASVIIGFVGVQLAWSAARAAAFAGDSGDGVDQFFKPRRRRPKMRGLACRLQ
jgi:hypothetical protein